MDVIPLFLAASGAFVLTLVVHRSWSAARRPRAVAAGARPPARRASAILPTKTPRTPPALTEAATPGAFATMRGAPADPRQSAVASFARAPPAIQGLPARPSAELAEEWESILREVRSRDSILAQTRERRLSRRRHLQSLITSIRDRDILYEKGVKVGSGIYSGGYADLADKLRAHNVCESAEFRSKDGEIEVRLTGTAVAREAPRIGTHACYLEAGLVAGAVKNIEGAEFDVKEIRCAAAGDPFCEFRATRRAS